MNNFRACTIVARNYTAQARILINSFMTHHHDVPFYTLIIDGIEEDRSTSDLGIVVLPIDLGLDDTLLHSMFMMYDVMELATSLKPALLMQLVRLGSDAVAYFDPDIRVYQPLTDVFQTAASAGIFLTPHALYPVPRDNLSLAERNIMQAGIYNLGFICVGSTAYNFLSWWHERLQVDAVVDIEKALFTDQRWIDWVPALFRHEISRDQGLNAAYWNLHEREITGELGNIRAGDAALRFFHFSGYDPAMPWLLSKHMGSNPRILLSEHPTLKQICDAYGRELVESGHPDLRKTSYRLDTLPNGYPISASIRRIFRSVYIGSIASPIPAPDPFLHADDFLGWLALRSLGSHPFLFSPLEYALWLVRPDLQTAFRDPFGDSGQQFRQWLDVDPEASKQRALLDSHRNAPAETEGASPSAAKIPLFGWSIVAYASAELGVGEAGRRVASTLESTGVPSEVVGLRSGSLSRQEFAYIRPQSAEITLQNAVICLNADQVERVSARLDLPSIRGRVAGLWFWELEAFTDKHLESLKYLTEVWVTSKFTYDTLEPVSDIPVHLIRLPIAIPAEPTTFTKESLNLPRDRYIFLTNFDFFSILERKNPIGTIRAYMDAFGPDDGAVLVVKSINGSERVLDFERMHAQAEGRSDIVFLDGYISSAGMQAMIELADCYVSLHRAEGFGLNMADAMARSTPVIATNYSGNLEFMDNSTAFLIPFTYTLVGPYSAPYDPNARWADPDLTVAAETMRELFDSPQTGIDRAEQAKIHVASNFSLKKSAEILSQIVMPRRSHEDDLEIGF